MYINPNFSVQLLGEDDESNGTVRRDGRAGIVDGR